MNKELPNAQKSKYQHVQSKVNSRPKPNLMNGDLEMLSEEKKKKPVRKGSAVKGAPKPVVGTRIMSARGPS